MCIRNASENIQAKFMYLMMMDGAAKLWFNTLPERSIKSWGELKTAFIRNFQGTCKQLYTLEDLDRCIQKNGESARKWVSRVMEILHSSMDINPRSALQSMEKTCKYEPLVQKLGRMKNSARVSEITMGEIMEACNKHASTDKTRDDEEDKGKGPANNIGKNNNNGGQSNNNNNGS